MEKPKTCGDLLEMLKQAWPDAYNLSELSELCGIPRGTMQYWSKHPNSPLARPGRKHWQRIFGGVPRGMLSGNGPPTATNPPVAQEQKLTPEVEVELIKALNRLAMASEAQTEMLKRVLENPNEEGSDSREAVSNG